jgi:GTPase Era involved in 16S rRNA processing
MIINSYLDQIDQQIAGIPETNNFYKKLRNILRIYYLGFLHILNASKIDKIKNKERILQVTKKDSKHLKHTGWITPSADNQWLTTEYMSQLKFNLLRALETLYKTEGENNFDSSYRNNFQQLAEVVNNNARAKGKQRFHIAGKKFELSPGEKIKLSESQMLQIVDEMIHAYQAPNN